MIRERALKILLVLSGLACLAGLYPLIGALREGVATTINRQDQMILGIYISLGVFLLIAARDPKIALGCDGGATRETCKSIANLTLRPPTTI